MPGTLKTVLILGGTKEAAEMARRLVDRGNLRVITALAGRTDSPRRPAGETRIGGFGGADGLSEFMRRESIDILVDATHPFAAQISANAVSAAEQTNTELLVFRRPQWTAVPGDIWHPVASTREASVALPADARVFLALGRQHLDAFLSRTDIHFILRMVDKPNAPPPFRSCDVIVGKPPPDTASEVDLLRTHRTTHVVCRNSGGTGAYAKIEAARQLSLPVFMIGRPPEPVQKPFSTTDALIAAIA
ncbi:MAG: cobalt-precorrin-6A reductase [Pseudomonadota bacterium]